MRANKKSELNLLRSLIRESLDFAAASDKEKAGEIAAEIARKYRSIIDKHIPEDRQTQIKMISTGIAISGRETELGDMSITGGLRGPHHSSIFQNVVADIGKLARDTMSGKREFSSHPSLAIPALLAMPAAGEYLDPSVGATQLKMSNLDSENLAPISRDLEIDEASDLDDVVKAVIVSTVYVYKMYKKAVSLGYSTNEPGVSGWNTEQDRPRVWTSTGDAALDLAVAGYNAGDGKVSNYCGTDMKSSKKQCNPGSPDIIKNYVPYLGDSSANTLFYVSYVAEKLPMLISIVSQRF